MRYPLVQCLPEPGGGGRQQLAVAWMSLPYLRGVEVQSITGRRRRVGYTALVALVAGIASLCFFTVEAGEFAVITQFGNPVRVVKTPGLHLKYPSPIQRITRFDNRLFLLVAPPSEFLTSGKKNVVASGFILWRIAEPRKFMQTVFDRNGAESRLRDILFAELGAALGGAPFSSFVSTVPGEYRAEAILETATRQYREVALRDYGIDVVDVRLQRLDFPPQNRLSVFSRMKSERTQLSMQYRSEGEEEGLKIRATAEKVKSGILAEAFKQAQKSRGEGEAKAAEIYSKSLNSAPAFYTFIRSLEAMKKSIDQDTTLILPLDSKLFQLLYDSHFQYPEE
jgi:membrane protease subunit HflC